MPQALLVQPVTQEYSVPLALLELRASLETREPSAYLVFKDRPAAQVKPALPDQLDFLVLPDSQVRPALEDHLVLLDPVVHKVQVDNPVKVV